MPGVPSELAEHALQLKDDARPVKQTMRRVPEPKCVFMSKEIDRLKHAGFIREIKKSGWLANPVMVEKKNSTALRMSGECPRVGSHDVLSGQSGSP